MLYLTYRKNKESKILVIGLHHQTWARQDRPLTKRHWARYLRLGTSEKTTPKLKRWGRWGSLLDNSMHKFNCTSCSSLYRWGALAHTSGTAGLHDTLTLARFRFHPSKLHKTFNMACPWEQTHDRTAFYHKCHNGLHQLDSQLALTLILLEYWICY